MLKALAVVMGLTVFSALAPGGQQSVAVARGVTAKLPRVFGLAAVDHKSIDAGSPVRGFSGHWRCRH
jgi:hypothetical protein